MTNTGGLTGTATTTIAAPGAFAGQLPIRVWPVANASACTAATTIPGSALSGTWAAPPALTASLNAGQSVVYCVRTTIPDWKNVTHATGSQSAVPVINVSLDASGWIATASTATNTQQTSGIYPLTAGFIPPDLSQWYTVRNKNSTGLCLDVSGSGSSGTRAITWSCHNNSNQRWQFIPVTSGDESLVTIRPRHAPGTRLTVTAGNVLRIQNTSAGSTTQQWYVQEFQEGATTVFQLVSASNGQCVRMNSSGSDSDMLTVNCNDPAAKLVLQREPLTLTSGSTVYLNFGSTMSSQNVRLQRWTGSSWTNVSLAAAGATSVSFARNNTNLPNGQNTQFRIVYASDTNDIVYGSITLFRSGNTVTAVSGIG